MKEIQDSERLALQTIVGAMHLAPEFGNTWTEIAADGFPIDAKVEMLLSSDSPVGVAKSMGLGTIGFADALDRLRPDILVVLGDRFEALAITQTALVMRIPVAHLHGGEVTEGAYDDAFRHAITKMAALHFTAAQPYRDRVIQLGEAPDTVFNVGAMGLDHLLRSPRMDAAQLNASLGFELTRPYFLATYHPTTLADEDPAATTEAMLAALDHFPGHQVVLTYPNADNGGRQIIPALEAYARCQPGRVLLVPSLGSRRYLTVLSGAAAVVGNSSSGLIEAPAFGVPTVNIGDRQRGRLCATSVRHCAATMTGIRDAIGEVLTPAFSQAARHASNPYGQGNAAQQIVRVLETHQLRVGKSFRDIPFCP